MSDMIEKAKKVVDELQDKLIEALPTGPNKELIREDMFYDMCSSSGWSREEIDKMEVRPDEIDLEEWSTEEFTDYIRKWFSKITGYYVEYKDGHFEFHNAVAMRLANMIAVNKKAKQLKESMQQDVYKIPVADIEKSLTWATNYVIDNLEDIPHMRRPDIGEDGLVVLQQ